MPSGPAIILVAGALYAVSVLFGRVGGLCGSSSPDAISKREETRHADPTIHRAFDRRGGCWAHPPPAAAQDKIKVVATFSILGDLVKNVGGDRVEVCNAGRSQQRRPCLCAVAGRRQEAGRRQSRVQQRARLRGLDRPAGQGLRQQGADRRREQRGEAAPGGGATVMATAMPAAIRMPGNRLRMSKSTSANIRDALIAADPAGKQAYEANAAAYLAKLDALDSEVRDSGRPHSRGPAPDHHHPRRVRLFPGRLRDRFHRAAGRFDGVGSLRPDVAKIITQIKKQKIPAVFLENVTDPRLIKRIADETGAKIGGTLYSDALDRRKGPTPPPTST